MGIEIERISAPDGLRYDLIGIAVKAIDADAAWHSRNDRHLRGGESDEHGVRL